VYRKDWLLTHKIYQYYQDYYVRYHQNIIYHYHSQQNRPAKSEHHKNNGSDDAVSFLGQMGHFHFNSRSAVHQAQDDNCLSLKSKTTAYLTNVIDAPEC